MENNYQEIEGDLIEKALNGDFDVIVQGNNCFCTQGAGLAPQMVEAFATDKFPLEKPIYRGDINKLGCIDYQYYPILNLFVVNAYTQYNYGKNHIDGSIKPLDYEALTLCMRKINKVFEGKHIGLPQIGAGLAGGDWEKIKQIIQNELINCKVTIVIYNKK